VTSNERGTCGSAASYPRDADSSGGGADAEADDVDDGVAEDVAEDVADGVDDGVAVDDGVGEGDLDVGGGVRDAEPEANGSAVGARDAEPDADDRAPAVVGAALGDASAVAAPDGAAEAD
jgi:hypothetical protein